MSYNSVTVSLILLAANSISFASPITLTYAATATGTLGATPFTNVAVTITALGDTADRQSFSGGFSLDHTSASILITGLGSFGFTSGTRTFVNNSTLSAGFSRAGAGADLLDFGGPFAAWDMLSSIGPISTTGAFLQWTIPPPVTTNGGTLVINDAATPVVFQAVVVPEPGTWVFVPASLVGFGLAACCRRRQNRATAALVG